MQQVNIQKKYFEYHFWLNIRTKYWIINKYLINEFSII